MGLVDYLSRHPSEFNEKQIVHNAKELWNSWFTVNTVVDVKTSCKLCKIEQPIKQNKLNEQPIREQERRKRSRINKKHDQENEQSVRIDKINRVKSDNAVQSVITCNDEKS